MESDLQILQNLQLEGKSEQLTLRSKFEVYLSLPFDTKHYLVSLHGTFLTQISLSVTAGHKSLHITAR